MAKIKKWAVFAIYMIGIYVLAGILVFLIYIEDEVDPNIIPLSHDGIAYVFAAIIIIGTFIFVGYMFFDVGLFFKGGRERERILKEGRSARAKIISLGESGESVMTINDQPFVTLILEVYNGNKKPYQVKMQTIIPRLDVPQFQPGVILAIKIDPQNPQNIALDPSGEGLGKEGGIPHFSGEGWTKQDRELLETKGIDGEAKILSVKDTGESKDFNPVVEISFEVYNKNKSPYILTKKIPLPTEGVNLVKTFIGKKVPVKIHPEDSSKVELKFNP